MADRSAEQLDLTGIHDYLSYAIGSGVSSEDIQEIVGRLPFQETSKKLSQTKFYLKQIYGSNFVYEPQQGFIRVQREDGKWNFFDQNKKIMTEEWFNYANDFQIINGKPVASVGTSYVDGTYFGTEYHFIKSDGQFLKEEKTTLKLLKGIKEPNIKMKQETGEFAEIFKQENKELMRILGAKTEIKPLPDYITPQIIENLKSMEMELRFIPEIDLGLLSELKRLGVEDYLKKLQERYPNWNNLENSYWYLVQEGAIAFPHLPGRWIAIETMPKPMIGEEYSPQILTKNRKLSWNEANTSIYNHQKEILKQTGLKVGEVRMLNLLEWNFLANREGWGTNNTFEWTNTQCRLDSLFHIAAGHSNAGKTFHDYSDQSKLGFRVAIIIPDSQVA